MKENTKNKNLKGTWPVMITPFDDDLKIDMNGYRSLLDWYLQLDVGGLYANCLSSEMYHLEPDERLLLISEAVKAANGQRPVAATGNLGGDITEHINFCRQVADTGVDVVMLVVPTFCENDSELEDYYLTIAEKVDAPLGLYECPVPRSYHLGVDLVEKLAETGRFVAYKETQCELPRMKELLNVIQSTPLALLQANIPYLLESVKAGAPGSMNVASIWMPDLVAKVIELGHAGDPAAERLQNILCAMEMAQRTVQLRGIKYLLSKRGFPIKMHVRKEQPPLSAEEIYGLDCAAEGWFREDGSLAIL